MRARTLSVLDEKIEENEKINWDLTEVRKVKKALLVIDMQNVCVGEKHATYF